MTIKIRPAQPPEIQGNTPAPQRASSDRGTLDHETFMRQWERELEDRLMARMHEILHPEGFTSRN